MSVNFKRIVLFCVCTSIITTLAGTYYNTVHSAPQLCVYKYCADMDDVSTSLHLQMLLFYGRFFFSSLFNPTHLQLLTVPLVVCFSNPGRIQQAGILRSDTYREQSGAGAGECSTKASGPILASIELTPKEDRVVGDEAVVVVVERKEGEGAGGKPMSVQLAKQSKSTQSAGSPR
jgi:hypothetical protein